MSQRSLYIIVLASFLVLSSAALILLFAPFTIDDAYITFTYAKNAASGRGFVFRDREYVEATSSFLWALLLTPFEWFGVGSEAGSKILGVLFFFASVALAYVLTERQLKSAKEKYPTIWPGLLASAISVTTASFSMWAVQGMENPLVSFLVMASVYFFTREIQQQKGNLSFLPIALMELARPEGFIFCGFFVLLRFCYGIIYPTLRGRWTYLWLVKVACVLIPYESWGYWYYGALLPNTVKSKVGSVDLARLKDGLNYLMSWVAIQPVLFALLTVSIFLLLLFRRRYSFSAHKPDDFLAFCLPILGVIVLQLLFMLITGGDWMPGARFASQLGPLLGPLSVVLWFHLTPLLAAQPSLSARKRIFWHSAPFLFLALYLAYSIVLVVYKRPNFEWIQAGSERAIGAVIAQA
ncbi:MAG: hypothetical protein J0M12_13365, partial [Deltaproteobacteria bacterium]|nr:hypothetical protein [Deltaproteobacteria bacterium]